MFAIEVIGTDIRPGQGFDRNPDGTIKTYDNSEDAGKSIEDLRTLEPEMKIWHGEIDGQYHIYLRRVVEIKADFHAAAPV